METKTRLVAAVFLFAISPDHLRTRRALSKEHYEYFEKLPLFIELPEYGAAVVHAGALPGIPVSKQDPYHLLHAQCVKPPAQKSYWPSKAPSDHTFWTNHWTGPTRLIFGHTVVVLPGWELVSVPSRQPADARGSVGLYKLHGDVHAFS